MEDKFFESLENDTYIEKVSEKNKLENKKGDYWLVLIEHVKLHDCLDLPKTLFLKLFAV